MIWFKRLPNVVLTLGAIDFYGNKRTVLTRAFRRNGKRWCIWDNQYMLLKDNGSCAGDTGYPITWEAI